jgi:hypothetical protein
MFIDINTIGSEGLSFERSVRLHGLEGPSRESLPDLDARLEGTVTPQPGGAALNARLETFPWDVRMVFAWKVLRRAPDAASPPGRAAVDDEASILVAPEGKIGLEDLATEQLYLNLPLKPICMPNCKGLCPTCGTNRNLGSCECEPDDADRALAPLLPFRRKLQDS